MPLDSGGRPADALEAEAAEGPLPIGSTSVSRRMLLFEASQKVWITESELWFDNPRGIVCKRQDFFNEVDLGQMSMYAPAYISRRTPPLGSHQWGVRRCNARSETRIAAALRRRPLVGQSLTDQTGRRRRAAVTVTVTVTATVTPTPTVDSSKRNATLDWAVATTVALLGDSENRLHIRISTSADTAAEHQAGCLGVRPPYPILFAACRWAERG